MFPTPGSTLNGHTDAVEQEIDTGDGELIRCAPRRMSPQKMKKEEECVTEMLTSGQIEPSDSPWSSPVGLVTKKDGGTRFCVDYRKLNGVTVKDAYPLPRIDDTLDMLTGKQWFSTLDLASGYWQVSLSREARAKTAFAIYLGLFQFKVMPFERLIDRVLQGLRWTRCLVYLDDIISFGSSFSDALDNLTLIFERLRSYGLHLKSTKCHLFRTSVPFLGHIVGRRGLECDPVKIEDVKSWPVPDMIVLRVFASSWVLSVIIAGLYQIGGIDGEGCPICLGYRLFDSCWRLVGFTGSRTYSGFSDRDRPVHLGH